MPHTAPDISRTEPTHDTRNTRARSAADRLERAYPRAGIQLHYDAPFELLVATILAAQCTDARVNTVTPALFERFPTPQAMADADLEEIERLIFSTGFYRNKAKSIQGMARALVERHNGTVPGTMEELLELPGVGRKTANVILSHCFDTPGVVVDTHVKRITRLLDLVDADDPEVIEREIETLLPPERWRMFSHLLAEHGRQVCVARRPQCEICTLVDICPTGREADIARQRSQPG